MILTLFNNKILTYILGTNGNCVLNNQGSNRNIFQRGQINFSDFFNGMKYFFPVENSHFGTPKTNFSGFEK